VTEDRTGAKPASIYGDLHTVSFVMPQSGDSAPWTFDVLAMRTTSGRPTGYRVMNDQGVSRADLAAMLEYAAALLRLPE
jgi:hypothetical protein